MVVSALAKSPSNPVRGLQYRTLADFDLGVAQMRLMGVRYYMAQSDEAKAQADARPEQLKLVTETGSPSVTPSVARWKIYEVLDSPLVEPLRNEPVVLDGRVPQALAGAVEAWFDDASALDRPLVDGGPEEWVRAGETEARFTPKKPLKAVTVSNIESGDDTVSFDVSEPGVPVLVKTSYFPNWQVKGAKGPWRASPNLMVVVPTGTHVSLHYGRTGVDWAGMRPHPVRPGRTGRPGPLEARAAAAPAAVAGHGGDGGCAAPAGPGPGGGPRAPLRRRTRPTAPGLRPTGLAVGVQDTIRPSMGNGLDTIFKAYDVRGLYPDEIDEDVARRVGNAFAVFTGAERIVVARDMRPSSVPLSAAFIEGATLAGASVVDAGLASTDLIYFAAGRLDAPGAMFTASHNPAQYNGIKLCKAGAAPVGQDTGLGQIKAAVAEGRLERADTPGTVTQQDLVGRVRRPRPRASSTSTPAVAHDDRGRHRQRDGGPRRPPGLRGPALRPHRPLPGARRDVPQPPRRSDPAREPARPPGGHPGEVGPTSGWPSTATPTGCSWSTTGPSRCRAR